MGNRAISDATIPVQAAEPARLSEDALAVVIGPGVFALALVSLFGADALGWVATASVWTDRGAAPATASKAYSSLGGLGALILTYVALAAVLSAAAYALGDDVSRFSIRFTVAFAIAYGSWFLGSWAYLAALTTAEDAKFGASWSLKPTSEGGVALAAGVVIANVFPAIRPRAFQRHRNRP